MLRDKSLYSDLDLRKYIDAEQLGIISETANAKYNNTGWQNYAAWGAPSNSTTWAQIVKNEEILVTASLLAVGANKPQRSASGWSTYTGSIPKIGHGMSLEEAGLMDIRQVQALTGQPYTQLFLESLNTTVGNLLGGVHNKLNRFTYQALSTGIIDETDNDGVSFKIDYRVKNHQGVQEKWFNEDGTPNEKATPVQDLLDFQRWAKKARNAIFDHWEASEEAYDAFLTHPDVIAKTAVRVNAYTPGNYVMTEAEKLTALHEMGILPIRVVDEKSAHEEDGVPVIDEPSFNKNNWVLSSLGNIFEMKCANSLYKDRIAYGSTGENNIYSFVDGRIAVLSTWQERPIKNIIDVELWALPVLKNPNNISILHTNTSEIG
jgi:hypothetical protein